MQEMVVTKIISRLADLPADTLQRVRDAIIIELGQYELTPKTTDLVLYTGTPQLLKLFIASKKVDGASPNTLKDYFRTLSKFLARLQNDPVKVTTSDIRMYLAIRESEGLKRSSLATLLATIKSFYSWLESADLIVKSPARAIPSIKTPKRVRKPLSPEELEKIRIACKTPRDKAMVEFFYSTGCRLDEVYKLNMDDIRWRDESCMVIGKGDKEREVYLNAKSKVHLQNYLKSRKDNEPALFVQERAPHRRVGKRSIEKVFAKLGKLAGINRPVFPHLIRHTTATNALNSGASLPVVQKMLGHESPVTTQIYADLNTSEIRTEHRKHVA